MARSRYIRRTAVIMSSTSSLAAVALALIVLGAFALRAVDKPSTVRIAVGPANSADAKFGEALGNELPKGFGTSAIVLVRTQSLSEAADAVDQGKAELAVVRTDVGIPDRAGTMLIVHRDAALFLAPAEAKIAEIGDLAGKKIGVVPPDPANVALVDAVLAQNGIDGETIPRVPLRVDAVADALAKKEIDVLVTVAPVGSDALEKAVTSMTIDDKPPVFLAVKSAEAFEQGQSGFVKMTIPGGLFAGAPPQPEDDIETIGVDYQLVASISMSEASVDVLTRTIFALRRALTTSAPIAQFMQSADTEKGSRFPLHVGATSYYEDTEKTFMDHYGDWFYIVAMAAGGIGSAIASLVSSLQARARRAAMHIVDRLCDLRHAAATAPDAGRLGSIENEVGDLAIVALQKAREGRFDQAGIETLRLAIDEARHVVSRRSETLRADALLATEQAKTAAV